MTPEQSPKTGPIGGIPGDPISGRLDNRFLSVLGHELRNPIAAIAMAAEALSRLCAEAAEAIYTIDSGSLVLSGNVLLTQGKTAISGQKLVIDLKAGSGVMEGRVQTVFQPKGGN